MSRTRKFMHTFVIGSDIGILDEHNGRVIGTFYPGQPMRGPSYASGGEPAEGPDFDIDHIEIEIGGAWQLYPMWLVTSSQLEALKENAITDAGDAYDGPDPDDVRDRRRDDALTDAAYYERAAE